jgi:hypothetical protein
MLKRLLLVIGSLGLMTVAACGGDDDDSSSGTGSTPGVSGDKQLGALTQDDLDKICKNIEAQYNSVIKPIMPTDESITKATCTAMGLMATMAGGTKATCETSRDQCITQYSSVNTGAADAGTSTTTCWKVSDFAGCTATVKELEACNTASINAGKKAIDDMKTLWGGLTCDNAGKPLDQSILNELNNQSTSESSDAGTIAECDVVNKKCPNVDGGV